ncbi:MAG: acyl-CoA thioesterase YciA [Gammaproteobacteria bacterium]|jgi:acyl-CoA thioesterase YciA
MESGHVSSQVDAEGYDMSDQPRVEGPPETPPERAPEMRTVAMPADTNANGDIFGGWLLAQMDLAGGTYAIHVAKGRTATVAIEAMSFHRPVYVGDLVSCYCETVRRGRTSLAVHVETWVRRGYRGASGREVKNLKVTEGVFTFVAIDDQGNKRPIG